MVGWWFIQRKIKARDDNKTKRDDAELGLKLKLEKERADTVEQKYQLVVGRLTVLETTGHEDSQSLALLRQEMLPMAEALKRKLVDILIHPSDKFALPDKILKKVVTGNSFLTKSDWAELKPLLKERATSTDINVTREERLAAQALEGVIRLAEFEKIQVPTAKVTTVQLVSSTVKSTETKAQEEANPEQPVSK